jgi:hypothetical protein
VLLHALCVRTFPASTWLSSQHQSQLSVPFLLESTRAGLAIAAAKGITSIDELWMGGGRTGDGDKVTSRGAVLSATAGMTGVEPATFRADARLLVLSSWGNSIFELHSKPGEPAESRRDSYCAKLNPSHGWLFLSMNASNRSVKDWPWFKAEINYTYFSGFRQCLEWSYWMSVRRSSSNASMPL